MINSIEIASFYSGGSSGVIEEVSDMLTIGGGNDKL